MIAQDAATELPKDKGVKDIAPPFFLSTERMAELTKLKPAEVLTQIRSERGRSQLFDDLMVHEQEFVQAHPDFHPEKIRAQLDASAEALEAKDRFLKDVASPEKKGIFRRAWDSVKGFAKNHPVVTALLVASLATGGVAAGFYAAGQWELLMASVGLQKLFEASEAAAELAPMTPATPPLPGGGVFDIPTPPSPPGLDLPL